MNTLALNPPFLLRYFLSLNWKINLRIFLVLSVLSIIALLIFYVFQVNAGVSERYLIQGYEEKLSEISKENQNLEISSVQANSLNNITVLIEGLNFEKTDKIYYIRVLDNQIVTK